MSSAATATVNAGELIVKWHITFRGAQPEESVQTASFVMLTPTLNIIRSKAE
jgi:predicted membrane-bound dolichyl-phosphate-mannose-protein mannosyltransferase